MDAIAAVAPVRGRPDSLQPPAPFPLDVPIPATFDAALRGMMYREFVKSRKWQEQQWRAVTDGAHPAILEFARLLIDRMAALGVPMFVAECIRTNKRQDELFALGHSRAKAGQSAHNYGCAVDIVHSTLSWNLSRKQWQLIGHVGQELAKQKGLAVHSLVWGGGWKFYDPAHWELKTWRMEKENFPWPKK